jgi:uncharacterized protein with WD repeat
VSLTHDGKLLAIYYGVGQPTQIWDLTQKKVVATLTTPYEVNAMFSPDGSMLLSYDYDKVTLWDTKTWRAIKTFEIAGVGGVSFSPDSARITIIEENRANIFTIERSSP